MIFCRGMVYEITEVLSCRCNGDGGSDGIVVEVVVLAISGLC